MDRDSSPQYGWKDVKAISQHVGTRNPTQVRTHAQKLLLRQQKERAGEMQASKGGLQGGDLPPLVDPSLALMGGGLMQVHGLADAGGMASFVEGGMA